MKTSVATITVDVPKEVKLDNLIGEMRCFYKSLSELLKAKSNLLSELKDMEKLIDMEILEKSKDKDILNVIKHSILKQKDLGVEGRLVIIQSNLFEAKDFLEMTVWNDFKNLLLNSKNYEIFLTDSP